MGEVTVQLGFDRASGCVTVDGKPHGEPIPAALLANALQPREQTHRQRLMSGAGRKSMVWAAMPKPEGK